MLYNLVLKNHEYEVLKSIALAYVDEEEIAIIQKPFNELGLEFNIYSEPLYEAEYCGYIVLSSRRNNFLISDCESDYRGLNSSQNIIEIDDNGNVLKAIRVCYAENGRKVSIKDIEVDKKDIKINAPNFNKRRECLKELLKDIELEEQLMAKIS